MTRKLRYLFKTLMLLAGWITHTAEASLKDSSMGPYREAKARLHRDLAAHRALRELVSPHTAHGQLNITVTYYSSTTVIFFSYFTAFFSVWLVVALTAENLLRVSRPLFAQRVCTFSTASTVTLTLAVVGIFMYLFSLWINGVIYFTQWNGTVFFRYAQGGPLYFQNGTQVSGSILKVFEGGYGLGNDVSEDGGGPGFWGAGNSSHIVKDVTSETVAPRMARLQWSSLESLNVEKGKIGGNNNCNSSSGGSFSSSSNCNNNANFMNWKTAYAENVSSPRSLSSHSVSSLPDLISIPSCTPLNMFSELVNCMTYLDSFFTLFLPLIVLTVIDSIIVFFAVRDNHSHLPRCVQLTSTRLGTRAASNASHTTPPDAESQLMCDGEAVGASRRRVAASLEKKASIFLFVVSVCVLLFHMPSHVIRLKLLLQRDRPSTRDLLVQRLVETIYYTHYAIGFFIYVTFGANFRRVFLSLVWKALRRTQSQGVRVV